jgi:hypothetical protein
LVVVVLVERMELDLLVDYMAVAVVAVMMILQQMVVLVDRE